MYEGKHELADKGRVSPLPLDETKTPATEVCITHVHHTEEAETEYHEAEIGSPLKDPTISVSTVQETIKDAEVCHYRESIYVHTITCTVYGNSHNFFPNA